MERPNTPLLDQVRVPADLLRLTDPELGLLADELRAENDFGRFRDRRSSGRGARRGGTDGGSSRRLRGTARPVDSWMSGTSVIRTRFSPDGADRIRTLRKGEGLSGFPPGDPRANTTRSAPHIPQPPSRRVSASPWHATCRRPRAMWSASSAMAHCRQAWPMRGDQQCRRAPPPPDRESSNDNTDVDLAAGRRDGRLSGGSGRQRAAGHANLVRADGFLPMSGPVDGHDMDALLAVLREAARRHERPHPHPCAQPSRARVMPRPRRRRTAIMGYQPSMSPPASRQNLSQTLPPIPRFSPDSLMAEAERDPSVVAVTAAMSSGTGLDAFQRRFPDRFFDVGIAEQHGVTFCAGMAAAGLRPFCAIYSTFLQRGYDQIVHRRRAAAASRALRDRPRRAGRRGRGHPCGRLRPCLSRQSAGLRHHGGRRRGRTRPYGGDGPCHRRPSVRFPLSARRGPRRAAPRTGRTAGDRARAHRARGHFSCAPVARRAAWENACWPQKSSASGASAPPSPTHALPSRWTAHSIMRLARDHEVLVTIERRIHRRFWRACAASPGR